MNPQIEKLLGDGTPSAEDIQAFIQENRFPLIEPGHVTFVFQGQAEEVNLRRWISGLSTAQSMQIL